MKIKSDYTSDISNLLTSIKHDTIFLSSWDKEENLLEFPISKINLYNQLNKREINKYFFSDELTEIKKNIISDNLDFTKNNITQNNFTFVTNGTIGALLCLLTILKEKSQIKAMLLSPIYYIYINILKDFDAQIYVQSGYHINCDKLASEIREEKINLVIVNNPLFGTGKCISENHLTLIQEFLLENNGILLVDNIYNGLKWNEYVTLNDFKLYKLLSNYSNFIILESLTKNLFLNGVKHCSIFSNQQMIKSIEANSVYLCGSLTATQCNFLKKLYNKSEHLFVINQLKKNIQYAKKMYDLLRSLLINSKFWISECESGVYCLIGIPREIFISNDDNTIAIEILKKTNILTLPHDRYLFESKHYYCFRVNLITEKNKLLHAICKLQDCFDI